MTFPTYGDPLNGLTSFFKRCQAKRCYEPAVARADVDRGLRGFLDDKATRLCAACAEHVKDRFGEDAVYDVRPTVSVHVRWSRETWQIRCLDKTGSRSLADRGVRRWVDRDVAFSHATALAAYLNVPVGEDL